MEENIKAGDKVINNWSCASPWGQDGGVYDWYAKDFPFAKVGEVHTVRRVHFVYHDGSLQISLVGGRWGHCHPVKRFIKVNEVQ